MGFVASPKKRKISGTARRLERRGLREIQDPLELPDDEFMSLYRITPDMAIELIDLLQPHIFRRERPYGLSAQDQVLVALRFYAVGCYQNPVGNQEGLSLSQPSVSRCIRSVTDAINNVLLRRWVRFPLTPNERHAARQKFSNANCPFEGTIGAIDCTHVYIRGPIDHEEAYGNRFGPHSLNVQAVCDPDYKIININARYPGARHDAYIWANSPVRRCMERNYNMGERRTWLIGDDGYGLEPWLMTPIPHQPPGSPEFLYTEALCQSRSIIERTFGVLKSTFRCLSQQRVLMYEPGMAGRIVNACAVIHNWRIDHRIDVIDVDPLEIDYHVLQNPPVQELNERGFPLAGHALGRRIQSRFITEQFGPR